MNAPDLTPPDLTPPTKASAKPKKEKAVKEPKTETAGGEKKERAPRQDYGFAPNAVIGVKEGEVKYRGKRKEWYDSVASFAGKTVKEWTDHRKTEVENDPPRGWLRFFVQDGTVTLTKPAEEAAAA